jgi:hypothetical protein
MFVMSDVYLTQCNRCANIYGTYYRIIIYTHTYIYIHTHIYIYIYLFFSTVYTPSLSIPVLLQTNSQELLMSNWGAPISAMFFPYGVDWGMSHWDWPPRYICMASSHGTSWGNDSSPSSCSKGQACKGKHTDYAYYTCIDAYVCICV